MIKQGSWVKMGVLFMLALLIHFFSANPFWVEKYYTTGLYTYISTSQRYLFGWLPFSIGDIAYLLFVIWIIWKLYKLIQGLIRKKAVLKTSIYKVANGLLIFYIIFNMLWGINYNRKGIAWQLGITMKKYTGDDLKVINRLLLDKVNESKEALTISKEHISNRELFTTCIYAYNEAEKEYPFLSVKAMSVKPSIWSWVGNYLGFTGYYNPFTGEAQVNTLVPSFLHPFTTCHEIAHQVGYAKEDEANFVGYLAATASKEPRLNYSVYMDMFQYCNHNLFTLDSAAARFYSKQLLPEVKADIKEWHKFVLTHQNIVEPAIRWLYGKYLQSNQQPSGVLSYDEVTGFLIAYHKKFGKI